MEKQNTPSFDGVRYWCFTCNQECQVENNSENDFQCTRCKSTFIEEITQDNAPQNYHPSLPQNTSQTQQNNNTQEENLIFLPSTVNCVVFNENQPLSALPSIMNNFGGFMNQIFNSNIFLTNNLFNGNVPLMAFLTNHNNDAQFENFLNLIMTFEQNLRGHPPASENAIKNLKKIDITKGNVDEFKDLECNICLSPFEVGETVTKLDCGHDFHDKCILHWLQMHNTCPVCRSEMESNAPNYENRKNSHRETLRNFHSSNNNNNNNNNNEGGSATV